MFLQFALTPGVFNGMPIQASLLILLLLKILFVLGAFLYLVFAFVVVRQIQVMKGTVMTPFSPIVQLIGLVHLLIAFAAVILAALML